MDKACLDPVSTNHVTRALKLVSRFILITYMAALHKSSQNIVPPPLKTNCSSLMLRVAPLLIDQCHTSCKLPGKNEKESDLFSLSGHIPIAAHVRSNCGWRNRVLMRSKNQMSLWPFGRSFPQNHERKYPQCLELKGKNPGIPKTIKTTNIPSIHIDHESHPQNELRPGGRTSVSPVIWRDHFHTWNMPLNQSLVDIKSHLTAVF